MSWIQSGFRCTTHPSSSLFFLFQTCPSGLCRTWVECRMKLFHSSLGVQMSLKILLRWKELKHLGHYSTPNKAPVCKGGVSVYSGGVRSLVYTLSRETQQSQENYFDQQPNTHLWTCTLCKWRGTYSRKPSRTLRGRQAPLALRVKPTCFIQSPGEMKRHTKWMRASLWGLCSCHWGLCCGHKC